MKFLATFITLTGLILLPLSADNKHTPPPAFNPTHPWLTDLDTALAQSKKTGKPILAEFR